MTIKKIKGGYEVESESKGKDGKHKNLGKSKTKAGAEKRLREVEYFKHHKGK